MNKVVKIALVSCLANVAFSVCYFIFGITDGSWWLLTLGSYYVVLSLVRLVVLRMKSNGRFIVIFTGIMLMVLSLPLCGTVILAVVRDRGHDLHMIVMIAVAVYAFTKITLATINLIRPSCVSSVTVKSLQYISLSDALASIFALQRSMLVSFDGMQELEIVIMNGLLGSVVCIFVFLLGLNLARSNKRKDQV